MNGRPTVPGYKRAFARLKYAAAKKKHADEPDHPALRAAFGRMLVYGGDGHPAAVPQRNSTSIESIAWHREAAAWPGYWNRTARNGRSLG